MKDNNDQKRNRDQQNNKRSIDTTTDSSGLHVERSPKGAEQMNKSFAKPDPDDLQYQSANLQDDNNKDSDMEKGHA